MIFRMEDTYNGFEFTGIWLYEITGHTPRFFDNPEDNFYNVFDVVVSY